MAADYENKVAVITGASSGVGAALAEELVCRGASVTLVARTTHKLEELSRRLGPRTLALSADMTRRAEVQRAFTATRERFGKVDIWVNNAGRGITRPVEQLTDEDLDTMMRDNLKSALYGMQTVLPHFKERGAGTVANVSSMLSRVPSYSVRSAYSASKAALNSLTESLRFELAREFPKISVVLVLPGIVATDFGQNALGGGLDSRQLPGAQAVDEVARIVADGLLTGAPDIYTRADGLELVVEHVTGLARPRP